MTKLFETIIPEAQEELVRDRMIEIVGIFVDAVPDPDRPEDWSAMTISADVYHDFRGGVRGKYASRYAQGSNIVVLSPDVAKLFPDSESVNRALRACGEIIRSQRQKKVGS